MVIATDASEIQVKETRQAFFAGAAVLFETIMKVLDPGEEPTDNDLQRMADLQQEIDDYGQTLDRKFFGKTEH